jgi:curli biogenesis system outer membrane secretion channel CsgG
MRTLSRVALLLLMATGCQPKRPNIRPVPPPAPQAPIKPPLPGYITPKTQKMTLGVMPFLDQTKRSEVAQLELADILTTELFRTGRFELVDRQQYKEDVKRTSSTTTRISPGGPDGQAKTTSTTSTDTGGWSCSDSCKAYDILDINNYVKNVTGGSGQQPMIDALLLGYVTGVDARGSGGSIHVDFRLVSFANQKLTGRLGDTDNLILYAGSAELEFTGTLPGGPVEIRREGDKGVTGIARQIANVFPPALVPSTVSVLSQVDPLQGTFALSAGLKSNIRLGLEGYIVEKETQAGMLKYIAAFSVIAVFPDTAVVAVYYPDRYREVIGRPVVFK